MCDPTSLAAATIIIGGASTAYTYYGQQEEAKAQNRFNATAAKEGQELARQSFDNEVQAMQEQNQQAQEAAGQQIQQVQKEAARARSTARVSAGEAGVAGLSVDALLADFDMQEAESIGAIKRNQYFDFRQRRNEMFGLRARGNQNIASTLYRKQRGPSAIGLGLSLGGQGLDAYTKYSQQMAKSEQPGDYQRANQYGPSRKGWRY